MAITWREIGVLSDAASLDGYIEWEEGDIAHTPFEPSGLVRILEIEPEGEIYGVTARVEFLEDHAGYPKGSIGRYQLKELRKQDS